MKINKSIILILALFAAIFIAGCVKQPATTVTGSFTTASACENYVKSQWCPSGYYCNACTKPSGSSYYQTTCCLSGSSSSECQAAFQKPNICSYVVCTAGDQRCNGNVVERCRYKDATQTEWYTYQTCGANQQCTGSSCKDIASYSCSDSDGGAYQDTKGTMTFYCDGETQSFTDSCSNGKVLEFACANVDKNNCLAQAVEVNCGSGMTCSSGRCVGSCQSKTCSQLGAECGTQDNGCGGTISCGSCLSGQTCSSGSCVSTQICTPNEKQCTSTNSYKQCNSAGTAWLSTTTCGNGQTCSSGNCIQSVQCTANNQCNDNDINTDDMCQSGVCVYSPKTCTPPQVLQNGVCVTPSQCSIDADCNDNNACTSDACVTGSCQNILLTTSECTQQCRAYEETSNSGGCSFAFNKIFTSKGFADYWEDNSEIVIGTGILIVLAFIAIVVYFRNKSDNPLNL